MGVNVLVPYLACGEYLITSSRRFVSDGAIFCGGNDGLPFEAKPEKVATPKGTTFYMSGVPLMEPNTKSATARSMGFGGNFIGHSFSNHLYCPGHRQYCPGHRQYCPGHRNVVEGT